MLDYFPLVDGKQGAHHPHPCAILDSPADVRYVDDRKEGPCAYQSINR
jgi:hypothetical protein